VIPAVLVVLVAMMIVLVLVFVVVAVVIGRNDAARGQQNEPSEHGPLDDSGQCVHVGNPFWWRWGTP
jgi:hypothetical protein